MNYALPRLFYLAGLLCLAVLLAGCAGLSLKDQHRLEQLRMDAEAAKLQVERKLSANPHSASKESLEVLDSILVYADSVKADPSRFSNDKLDEYVQKIQIIQENLGRFSDLTLQADVSFPLGKYRVQDLSDYAKQENDNLVAKIVASVAELEAKHPGQRFRVTLKIAGYTDETPFTPGTSLEKAIIQELGGPVRGSKAEKRAAYNRVLSRFRAESLGAYLEDSLRKDIGGAKLKEIQVQVFGEGEKPPEENAKPPYQPTDPRRRVSIVSPFVEIIP